MPIIAHTENADILSAEWLDEDDVDLSGITVPHDGSDKSVVMPIITIAEHLASSWENDN